ncbi:hypothetical protein Bbelb_035760 [Branchiostoma belcheri]|nr:hypothetical protein Bbelb_035760 [Branchiostoma belcheri]
MAQGGRLTQKGPIDVFSWHVTDITRVSTSNTFTTRHHTWDLCTLPSDRNHRNYLGVFLRLREGHPTVVYARVMAGAGPGSAVEPFRFEPRGRGLKTTKAQSNKGVVMDSTEFSRIKAYLIESKEYPQDVKTSAAKKGFKKKVNKFVLEGTPAGRAGAGLQQRNATHRLHKFHLLDTWAPGRENEKSGASLFMGYTNFHKLFVDGRALFGYVTPPDAGPAGNDFMTMHGIKMEDLPVLVAGVNNAVTTIKTTEDGGSSKTDKIANPLQKLTVGQAGKKKGRRQWAPPFYWSRVSKAFDTLKKCLMSADILTYPDFPLPFTLYIDASHDGLGAILSQEQKGVKRVIAYASRGLRSAERNMNNYSSFKLLGLKCSVTDKFKDYLYRAKCTVFTDNNPLAHLGTAQLGAVGQRRAGSLANFDFEVEVQAGEVQRPMKEKREFWESTWRTGRRAGLPGTWKGAEASGPVTGGRRLSGSEAGTQEAGVGADHTSTIGRSAEDTRSLQKRHDGHACRQLGLAQGRYLHGIEGELYFQWKNGSEDVRDELFQADVTRCGISK